MESLLRTALLLASVSAAGAGAGALWVGPAGARWGAPAGLALGLLALVFAGPLLLRLYRARRVDETAAPQLVRTVEQLAARAGVRTPAVYLIDEPAPVAFATGSGGPRAAIALSTGLLALLSEGELRATVAHELAHVRRGDVHALTLGTLLSGLLIAIALAALAGDADGDDGGPSMASWLPWLLAPLAALPLRLAAGRAREFEADRLGAHIAGDARALADALYKIGAAPAPRPVQRHPQTASVLIAVPAAMQGWRRWLAGQPPTAERIARLRAGSTG